jgi:transposase-like protein
LVEDRGKYAVEEIVFILEEHWSVVPVKEVIRQHGISLDTFYRWTRAYKRDDQDRLAGGTSRRLMTNE